MNIKVRLGLFFSLIVLAMLVSFAAVVYYRAAETREKEFYSLLEMETLTKANLFFEAKIDPELLQTIHQQNRQLIYEVEVAIYKKPFELLYHDAVDIDVVKETPEMIENISKNKKYTFVQGEWQGIGLSYLHNNEEYILTAAAYDAYGLNKLRSLRNTLLALLAIATALSYPLGMYLAKKSLEPLAHMRSQAREISAKNLNLRLKSGRHKDELQDLADTFNQMLDRLENSFESQKNFVQNISHELRTPLAALIAELELTLQKTRSPEEYQQSLKDALSDARNMSRLANSLLDFAKASYDPGQIDFKNERLDELLMEACTQLQSAEKEYKIHIEIQENGHSAEPLVKGNPYLLKTALLNLMENACKFSENKECKVLLGQSEKEIWVQFQDRGMGISTEDREIIFKPFGRAKTHVKTKGHGIGLSLTKRIIELHHGTLTLESELGKGSTFTMSLNKSH